ncbi:Fic family protein [Sphingomonas sp.]|uniref:Fic family protein n=1 Tax=Sphingomonas sp. TaxID=28214 RepID=UPI0025D6A745|nr:Fic family protein [Sphingomonas sp.]
MRERLQDAGFLREVMRGWYIASRPDEPNGESTAWYASFWGFCAEYLTERFGEDWVIGPEQSLILHAGNRTVPTQLLVRAKGGRNNPTGLIHGTSIFDTNVALPPSADRVTLEEGVHAYRCEPALILVSAQFYLAHPTDARAVLASQTNTSELLARLLDGNHSVVAGRLAGAFRNIGHDRVADDILGAMKSAGFDVREADPFERPLTFALPRDPSPASNRIRLMWQDMRQRVIDAFPPPPRVNDVDAYLTRVEENYVNDAYNSLSIEGYKVSKELIERVRDGNWNPDANEADKRQRDALAARGYYQAFQAVKASLGRILSGDNAGDVADRDHQTWYRELFAPSVQAGILTAVQLAGYRNMPVYIRGSRHVPMGHDAARDAISTFFELLRDEPEASVRVVLGHYIFVFIHPYIDGNGRIGRFLMNAMMASGGYPWTVIPVARRDEYMAALEAASVDGDIGPFADFIAGLLEAPAI